MASRLKLRKKKYHPPLEETTSQSNIESKNTNDKLNKTNKKTYAQVLSSSTQNFDENEIFLKAIESASKHKIKLKAGRKDRGYGNCAFESVINNINDRDCFSQKLLQSPNWYRRSWMDQMMKRILMGTCPWNLGYTDQQVREGFAKLQESGIYEIDFFGDMMMGGIACGIRKRILIFNTSENLLHDPISVVDPQHYDARIKIDNETPVVVAYNNYHYENLHTIDEQDTQETKRLVDSYINDRYSLDYGFTKKDIKYLLSPSPINTRTDRKNFQQEWAKSNISINGEKKQSHRKQYVVDNRKQLRVESKQAPNQKSEQQIDGCKFKSEGPGEQEMHKQPWIAVPSKQNQKTNVEIKKNMKNMPTDQ